MSLRTQLRRRLLLLASLLLALLFAASPALAQEPPYFQRFDVTIDIQPNGDIIVTEEQTVLFGSTARHGFREIPLDRVEQIADVSVSEPNQQYQQRQGQGRGTTGTPNTYQVEQDDGFLRIDWWFPPTSNATRTFAVRYRVVGGLRYYEGGDQLFWKAVYEDRPLLVQSSTVLVRFPADVQADQIRTEAYPDSLGATGQLVDPRTVRFDARNIPADTGLEVRVQFPHGLVAGSPPAWQAAADREDQYNSTVKPLLNLFLGVAGILVLVLGSLWVFLRWYSRGRDPSVGELPTTLSDPPGDLPPAVAGTLVDERADVQDAVATLVDLARRGVLRIVEQTPDGDRESDREFRLERLQEDPPGLREYERAMFNYLFGGRDQVRLSELKTRFRMVFPTVANLLYDEVTRAGLFRENPETVRKRYRNIGGALLAAGFVFGCVASLFLFAFAELAFFPFVALGFLGLVMLILAGRMPRRTQLGALEAGRWRAFGRYLKEQQPPEELSSRLDRFEPYLPYAIALGADREWVRKFAAAGAPAPEWYERESRGPYIGPIFWGFPGGRRPTAGEPAGEEGGLGGLEGLSEQGAFGLQGLSDSLVEMLNSASKTLSSGGRGGGGGWSGGGGGGFGGGGGGGGRGGFG